MGKAHNDRIRRWNGKYQTQKRARVQGYDHHQYDGHDEGMAQEA